MPGICEYSWGRQEVWSGQAPHGHCPTLSWLLCSVIWGAGGGGDYERVNEWYKSCKCDSRIAQCETWEDRPNASVISCSTFKLRWPSGMETPRYCTIVAEKSKWWSCLLLMEEEEITSKSLCNCLCYTYSGFKKIWREKKCSWTNREDHN